MDRFVKKSPRILSVGWGTMNIERIGAGKDFKLWPGGGASWDWRETGTQHSPGVQVSDVQELVEQGCQVVVLANGVFSRLKVEQQTRLYLEQHGIKLIVAATKEAVKIYNDFAEKGVMVGGLFHTTC